MTVNLKAFLDRLGIADEIAKKVAFAFTGEEAVQKVAKGEADIVLAFVSEILPVRGVKWLGPATGRAAIPDELFRRHRRGQREPGTGARASCCDHERRKGAASSATRASNPVAH